MRFNRLWEMLKCGTLTNEMLDSCVWNEEVFAEQAFEVGVKFLKTDGLCEPPIAPPETVRGRYPGAAPGCAFAFRSRWNVDNLLLTGCHFPQRCQNRRKVKARITELTELELD